jgi:virginiamycin B lyase
MKKAALALLVIASLVLFLAPLSVAKADYPTPILYPVPSPYNGYSNSNSITSGPDGDLWFTELDRQVVSMSVQGTIDKEFEITLPNDPILQLWSITTGSDGNLWFSLMQYYGNGHIAGIARMTPAGAVTVFTDPNMEYLGNITEGPDGNIWAIGMNVNGLFRITPSGNITFFPIPNSSFNSNSSITSGPDGNLWFTDSIPLTSSSFIGRVAPDGSGLAEFTLPNANESPFSITSGPDGNLWFTNSVFTEVTAWTNWNIAKITLNGNITEYPVPKAAFLWNITSGRDGNLWFTDPLDASIGWMKTDGTSAEIKVPGGNTNSYPTNCLFAQIFGTIRNRE